MWRSQVAVSVRQEFPVNSKSQSPFRKSSCKNKIARYIIKDAKRRNKRLRDLKIFSLAKSLSHQPRGGRQVRRGRSEANLGLIYVFESHLQASSRRQRMYKIFNSTFRVAQNFWATHKLILKVLLNLIHQNEISYHPKSCGS